MFVYVPTKFRVYEGIGEFPALARSSQWQSNDLPDQMAKWNEESNIEFVDLTPLLKSAASEQLLYFSDDSHWNAAGHEIVGRALARLIASRDWVSDAR